jgi:hypothetical protein
MITSLLSRSPRVWPALAVLACTALVLALSARPALANNPDRIVLKNGSVILGTISDARDGKLELKTDFAGTLEVDQNQVAEISSEQSLKLQLDDGTVVASQPLRVEGERLLVEAAGQGERSYALSQLLRINPEPWELGQGYKWEGRSGAGFTARRGNTETNELTYDTETRWIGSEDRFTLRLQGQVSEANGRRNAENTTFSGKYDRFLENDWYYGANAQLLQDRFADIRLRSYLGPYVGRGFDAPFSTRFEAEVGVSYVDEDFFDAPDRSYPGATWNLDARSDYLGDDIVLYLRQDGIWDLQRTEDMIVNTTFGVTFPLLADIEGSSEVLLRYNSGAVAGVNELDQTYRFRIGYRW